MEWAWLTVMESESYKFCRMWTAPFLMVESGFLPPARSLTDVLDEAYCRLKMNKHLKRRRNGQANISHPCARLHWPPMMLASIPERPRHASSTATLKVRDLLSVVSATYAKQPAKMAVKSPERPLRILPMRK